MKMLYDIGDRLRVTMTGTLIEYSASKHGDCYVIELDDNARGLRVYLDGDVVARDVKPYHDICGGANDGMESETKGEEAASSAL